MATIEMSTQDFGQKRPRKIEEFSRCEPDQKSKTPTNLREKSSRPNNMIEKAKRPGTPAKPLKETLDAAVKKKAKGGPVHQAQKSRDFNKWEQEKREDAIRRLTDVIPGD